MRANDDLGCPHRPSALGNPVDSVRSDIALGPRLGLQPPRFALAASRADKAVRPARREEVGDAGRLIWEAALELDQGAGKIGHGGLANR